MYLVTAKTKATAQDFPGSTVEWAVGQTREVHDSLIQEFKNNPAAWTVSGGATTSTVTATSSAQGVVIPLPVATRGVLQAELLAGTPTGSYFVDNAPVDLGGGGPTLSAAYHVFANGTDDTTAVAAAISAAKSAEAKSRIVWLHGDIRVTDTIPLPSYVELRGDGPHKTIVRQLTAGKPAIASESWISALGVAQPSGYASVRDLKIVGASGATAHGVVMRDFYAQIENVEVWNAGGDGFRLDVLQDSGATAVGFTCVENKYGRLLATGCAGYGFHSPSTTIKFTDAMMEDIIVMGLSSGEGGSLGGIKLAHCAGWQISKLHTYGVFVNDGIQLNQMWCTTLNSAQVEYGWKRYGLSMTSYQRGSTVSNVSVACWNSNGGTVAVFGTKQAVNPGDGIVMSNITLIQDFDRAVTGISWDSVTCPMEINGLSIQGLYPAQITKLAGAGAGLIRVAPDLKTLQTIRDTSSGNTLTVNGSPLALADCYQWSGAGPVTVTIPINKLGSYKSMSGILNVNSLTNYNGSQATKYLTQVVVSAKDNAADAWTVVVNDLITATGFSSAPVVAAAHTLGSDSGSVTITFTPTASTGYGHAGIVHSLK